MKLTKRLQAIADLIKSDTQVIDVGCDHALLDVYLTIKKNVKCTAVDISEKSIKKSMLNIKLYNLVDQIKLIKSDGLKKIDIHDDHIIVIAGMGTKTIVKILSDLKTRNELILLSNKDVPILRKAIIKKGYYIADEVVVTDFKKDYVIIKFLPGYEKYDDIDILVGPIIKKRNDYNFYIVKELNRYNKQLLKIPKKNIIRRFYLSKKIKKIKKICNN